MTELEMKQSLLDVNPALLNGKGYQLKISQSSSDPAWDTFLAQTSGGHHVQTSLWAQVKAILGWNAVRFMLTQDDQIVAGAQILHRPLPVGGAVGYVSKGPLCAINDPDLTEMAVDELQKLAKAQRIQHLTVQPAGSGDELQRPLTHKGFQPCTTEVAPPATLLLDLSDDIDTLMANMNRKTRYNIRLSARKGITVRDGTREDLDTYYRILTATGERQNFSPFPKKYYEEMWRILQPLGYLKLFIAEYEGEVLSAQLAVPFGDTMINKLSVWSGQHGNLRPNHALQWAAIQWAKEQGFRYYDFEGIKPEAAKAILANEPLSEKLKQTVTSFKLGFGGQPVIFSGAYDHLYNPLYRWTYFEIFPRVKNRKSVKKVIKRLRTQ